MSDADPDLTRELLVMTLSRPLEHVDLDLACELLAQLVADTSTL